MRVGVELRGLPQARKALTQLIDSTRAGAEREVRRAAISTASKAKKRPTPKAFGNLIAGIIAEQGTNKLEWVAASTAPYAAYVEGVFNQGLYGRRPGRWPPPEPIRRWVELRGLPSKWGVSVASATFLVRKKIGERGTPAQPHLFPAAQAEKPRFEENMAALFAHAANQAAAIGRTLR